MSEESSTQVVVFKDQLNTTKKGFSDLLKLYEQVFTSPTGSVTLDTRTITRKDLGSYRNACLKQLDELNAIYARDTKRNKKKGNKNNKKKTGSNPMYLPIYINSLLVKYFKSIDLGKAYRLKDENDETSFVEYNSDLKKCLPLLLEKGIASSALLTPLFIIITKLYKFQDDKNRQFVIPDKNFSDHFGRIFEDVERERHEKLALLNEQLKNATDDNTRRKLQAEIADETKKTLDPNRFRSVRFQTIVSRCRAKELTEEQKELLKDPEIIRRMNEEQNIVSQTLKHLKYVNATEQTQ